jgi:hypothetical protein
MLKNITKTNNLNDIRKVSQEMGDNITDLFYTTQDIKVAAIALKAYNTAISCVKTQLINKKMTGKPATIQGIN